MGLWSAVSIGVGGMVGAGIFSILGSACTIGGNAVYLSFLIAGVVALFSTYSYAKLGARYPSAGGPVEFLIQGFGDGVFSGGLNIMLWIGYLFALALYAKAFGAYFMTFFSGSHPVMVNLAASLVIVLFALLEFVGTKAVGKAELYIVAVKVGILILFAVSGAFFIKPGLLSPARWPSGGSIIFAAAMVFLAYEGFGLITNAAEDMTNPERDLPRALYLAVFIVILIYLAISVAVIGNLPLKQIIHAQDYALAEAARPFLGDIGFRVIAVAALLSTASAINASLYGGANVSYMLAREGELPEVFDRKVWRTGREGLLISAGFVILLVNLFNLEGIAMMGSAAFLIIYGAVNFGHLRLLDQTHGKAWVIWLAILGNIGSFAILCYYLFLHSIVTLIALISILGASFLVEFVYRRLHPREIKTRQT